ncbi:MAG: PKD domain-containing protein, partial [Anaerolineae bacterium]|nr:PKD domain-containing protein [Anaerolineae bacterium]
WLSLGGAYRLYPGDSLTLSNGFLTKTHTISALQVSSVDYGADLVCGTAEAGFEVETRLQYDELFFQRYETPAGDGTWCADYSVPGDEQREQNTFDLLPFTEGTAHLRDEDGDTTQLTFPYNLVAWVDGEHVDGSNWLADVPVTLGIDDPLTPAEPDYTDSATPTAGPWFLTGVQFDLFGLFDFQPGQLVRFTQGDWLKELIVSADLAFTEINYLANTVSGTAAPGAHIMTIHGYGGAARMTVADASGEWSVDYAVPGDHLTEGEIADLLPGDNIMAAEADQDADSTNISRRIDTPCIDAGKTYDDLAAIGFARAGTVTLAVDDPATVENPDYLTAQVIGNETVPWNDLVSYQLFELPDWLDLQSGTVVTISDDDVTRQIVLADHEITDVNLINDTVSGTATPGIELRILLSNEGVVVARRGSVAGIDGTWSVSFALPGTQVWEQDIADIHSGSQLTASIFDDDGDRTRVDWSSNQPPVITAIQAPADPAPINIEVDVSAAFNDLDLEDTHSALWEWGDGTTADGSVDEGAGVVSGAHVYSQVGVYTLGLTLCDTAGACDSASYQYLVVYDPEGGFVTGGGWIDSPAGAYTPAPELVGPAHFGFVSKYKKGAVAPDGNTQFQFQVADLNFQSDTYQWLVIAGYKALFKGSGTVNGAGEYGFLISAVDGDLKTDGAPDCFRIKIWELASKAVIYDNQLDADEDAEPTTQLAAGSIVIHKAK